MEEVKTVTTKGFTKLEAGTYNGVDGFDSWVGTENWIVFQTETGELIVFNGRDKNGAVIGIGTKIHKASHDHPTEEDEYISEADVPNVGGE